MTDRYRDLSVADLMRTEIVTCAGSANLGEVAKTLARAREHAVFVLDEAGEPAGVVSDFDLLASEWMGSDPGGVEAMRSMTAAELMSAPLETIAVGASAREASARLREQHLSRLLVLDADGAPAGVISVSDLIAPLGGPSGNRRQVSDVMSYAIVTCLPETSLEAAARAMAERRSRSVIVIDETGRAVGVITGGDLLSLYEPDEHADTVADLMTTSMITAPPDLGLSDAVEMMVEHEVHRLVVIDPDRGDGAPIGVLSTSDILAEVADERSVWQRGM
jgi:CBS domain-containing protein